MNIQRAKKAKTKAFDVLDTQIVRTPHLFKIPPRSVCMLRQTSIIKLVHCQYIMLQQTAAVIYCKDNTFCL